MTAVNHAGSRKQFITVEAENGVPLYREGIVFVAVND